MRLKTHSLLQSIRLNTLLTICFIATPRYSLANGGSVTTPTVSDQFRLVIGKYSLPRETHTDDKGWSIPEDLWQSYEEFEDSGYANDEWRQIDSEILFTPIALEPVDY